ncbi:MAG: zinc ribbon domain-containing protein [Hormoscilla sp. GM102CHS1]|nr:zinc ribbon domain-containing protein [Hormoscilla sp. GM102CHS1]
MLICPQCEFSNPVSNKFCYRCGISLIEKKCHECGSVVPFYTVKCHNCNAVTGTVRWALVCSGGVREPVPGEPDETAPRHTTHQIATI